MIRLHAEASPAMKSSALTSIGERAKRWEPPPSEKNPLVSVLMAAYNSEKYIGEALESALTQTYERLEIIVADDGSTDKTLAIVEQVAKQDRERVTLLRGGNRRGPCRNRNGALARARGSLICWLDADDVWLPTKVEKQVRVMAARQDVALVHTRYEAFDSDTGQLLPELVPELREGSLLAPLFLEGCIVGSLTAMFRRQALEERGVGLRTKEFGFGDDYYAWLLISLRWKTAAIDEVLARYRRHAANLSVQHENFYLNYVGLLEEFAADYPEARRALGRRYRIGIGRHYSSAGAVEAVKGNYLRAARYGVKGARRDPVGLLRRLLRRLQRYLRETLAEIGSDRVPSSVMNARVVRRDMDEQVPTAPK